MPFALLRRFRLSIRSRRRVATVARRSALAVAVFIAIGFAGVTWLWATTDLPSQAELPASSVILDRNGEEFAVLSRDGVRFMVDLEDVDENVVHALLAAEDRSFYEHKGIDPAGVVRALAVNLTSDSVQGGSTITQQLVKNEFLTSERTITRKVREAILSVKLERKTDKDDILQRYLNTVYFGRGAYGIEAAARAYFGASASNLSPAQAALLVSRLPAPERNDPSDEAAAATTARDQVLDDMVETGALTADEGERHKRAPLRVVADSGVTDDGAPAPHFVEWVREQVVELLGDDAIYQDGLVIESTLDMEDQLAAEAAVADGLDGVDAQAAVVGLDKTGAVRAWVGGRSFSELQVDILRGVEGGGSGRQPGSTFKPIVLATLLREGGTAKRLYAAPASVAIPVGGQPWNVSNAGNSAWGLVTIEDATVSSLNTVYAQATMEVGPAAVVETARALGMQSVLGAHPSVGLGTEEVAPIDIATAYLTFAREGSRVTPFSIERITDRSGGVVFEADLDEVDAVDVDVARTVTEVLRQSPIRGTARGARLDRPMAAKTGTTQNSADGWLAGYTPEYTAVVWVGDPDGSNTVVNAEGRAISGGGLPATIWRQFMEHALVDVDATDFTPPSGALLRDEPLDERLSANPSKDVEPGSTITVLGAGMRTCISGWFIEASGSAARPGAADNDAVQLVGDKTERDGSSPSGDRQDNDVPTQEWLLRSDLEQGSSESDRDARIAVPGDAVGAIELTAYCDRGVGAVAVADLAVSVRGGSDGVPDGPDLGGEDESQPSSDAETDQDTEGGSSGSPATSSSTTSSSTTTSTSTSTTSTTTTTAPERESGGKKKK